MKDMTPIQAEFAQMVKNGTVFFVKGCSLCAHGRTFPIAMVQKIGATPKVDNFAAYKKAVKIKNEKEIEKNFGMR